MKTVRSGRRAGGGCWSGSCLQRKGNSGLKHQFESLDPDFDGGSLVCWGPGLNLGVSRPHVRFSAWKSSDHVGVREMGRKTSISLRDLPFHAGNISTKPFPGVTSAASSSSSASKQPSHGALQEITSIDKMTHQNGWKVTRGYFLGGEELCVTVRKLWCVFSFNHPHNQ